MKKEKVEIFNKDGTLDIEELIDKYNVYLYKILKKKYREYRLNCEDGKYYEDDIVCKK